LSLDYLEFYALSGVQSLIGEEQYNYENEIIPSQVTKPAEVIATITPHSNLSSINSLEDLKSALLVYEDCFLKKTTKNTLFGEGNIKAKVMIIGDAPDADEDREGKPFVGMAGDLLNAMLKSISIKREDCYLTPFIPWRPPGGRVATRQEIMQCLPFLKKQIELVSPDYLLVFGGTATNSLLNISDTILKSRGKFYDYEGIKLMPTLHPINLMKQPLQKKLAWADLLVFKAAMS
jgi:uracil-DNA glycosylase